MGCPQKAYLLEFLNIDISRDFVHILSQALFFTRPSAPLTTSGVSVLRIACENIHFSSLFHQPPLYHGGGMTLRVRPRVKLQSTFASLTLLGYFPCNVFPSHFWAVFTCACFFIIIIYFYCGRQEEPAVLISGQVVITHAS